MAIEDSAQLLAQRHEGRPAQGAGGGKAEGAGIEIAADLRRQQADAERGDCDASEVKWTARGRDREAKRAQKGDGRRDAQRDVLQRREEKRAVAASARPKS